MKKTTIIIWLLVLIIIILGAHHLITNHSGRTVPVVAVVQDENNVSFAEDEHRALDNGADYRISATASGLAGIWQSADDAKFKREFKADATLTDTYQGDASATSTGSWSVFTKENPDKNFTGIFEDGVTYLKVTIAGDNLYYKLLKVTPEELDMVYLLRGNVLKFKRL